MSDLASRGSTHSRLLSRGLGVAAIAIVSCTSDLACGGPVDNAASPSEPTSPASRSDSFAPGDFYRLIDELWRRSAIRYAHKVRTPTMFVHGENDNNVPIAEAEQFLIALKDVGVET